MLSTGSSKLCSGMEEGTRTRRLLSTCRTQGRVSIRRIRWVAAVRRQLETNVLEEEGACRSSTASRCEHPSDPLGRIYWGWQETAVLAGWAELPKPRGSTASSSPCGRGRWRRERWWRSELLARRAGGICQEGADPRRGGGGRSAARPRRWADGAPEGSEGGAAAHRAGGC